MSSRRQRITPTQEQSFGKEDSLGTSQEFARRDHTHGTMDNPIDAHLSASDPHTQYLRADGGRKVTGNLDINYRQLLRAADHKDVIVNIPVTGNEVEAQTFFATDICTLFKFCDGAWRPLQSFDSVAYYVDGVNGTDALGKGYASGAGATKTIPYALNLIPPLYGGNVTATVAAGTYREKVIIQGKAATGNYTLTLIGTLSTLDTGTATSATTNTWRPTLTDTTKTWTVNAYTGKILRITGGTGAGQERLIDSNTATVLTLVGNWLSPTPDATSAYSILDFATVISGADAGAPTTPIRSNVLEIISQRAVRVKDLQLTYATADQALIRSGSADVTFDRVSGVAPGKIFYAVRANSQAVFRRCYATGALVGFIGQNSSVVETYGCLSVAHTSRGILMQNESVHLNSNTPSDGDIRINTGIYRAGTGTANGVEAATVSMVQADGLMENNGGWGALANNNSILSGPTSGSFSGNTSGSYVQYADVSKIKIGAGTAGATHDLEIGGTFKAGGATNYTELEADGTLHFVGNATVWDDLLPAPISVGVGAAAPAYTSFNGNLKAYEFVGAAMMKEVNMAFQLRHGYKEGSNIIPHIHLYVPDDVTGGTIKFGCEYTWVNKNGAEGATTTVYNTLVIGASAGNLGNEPLSFGEITGTGKVISSLFSCRIFRDPTDAADTFGSSVWLKSSDLHVEQDTVASRELHSK